MMIIKTQQYRYADETKEYFWKCDEEKPVITAREKIISIHADEAELDIIIDNFQNIPIAQAPLNIWKAPFAQFIYDNL